MPFRYSELAFDLNVAAFVHLFLLLYELFNIAFEIFEIMMREVLDCVIL